MAQLRRSKRTTSASYKEPSSGPEDNDDSPQEPVLKRQKTDTPVETEATTRELQIGDPVPDMSLLNQDGEQVSLKSIVRDNRIVVIFAYPKANTPGCTRQACGFRDNFDDLKKHAKVFGLSADTTSAQKKFQDKFQLPFPLLCDPKRELVGILGAKKSPKSGIVRSHFIFCDGKLASKRLKVSPEVSVTDSKLEVLSLVKEM